MGIISSVVVVGVVLELEGGGGGGGDCDMIDHNDRFRSR